jgi:hypothetical protein
LWAFSDSKLATNIFCYDVVMKGAQRPSCDQYEGHKLAHYL